MKVNPRSAILVSKEGNAVMAERESKKRWDRENMVLIGLKLSRNNHSDIIAFLESKGKDKQNIIREAVREYMANHAND